MSDCKNWFLRLFAALAPSSGHQSAKADSCAEVAGEIPDQPRNTGNLAQAPPVAEKERKPKYYLADSLTRLAKVYPHISNFSLEYFRKTHEGRNFVFKDGAWVNEDIHNKCMNITDGFRKVTDQPAQSENTIWLFGDSVAFSAFSEDRDTISSSLQRICNKEMPGRFTVVDRSVRGSSYSNAFMIFSQVSLKRGDVVIFTTCRRGYDIRKTDGEVAILIRHITDVCRTAEVFFAYFSYPGLLNTLNPSDEERSAASGAPKASGESEAPPVFAEKYLPLQLSDMVTALGCPCYDLQPYFNRPHSLGEVFVDKHHIGPFGNKAIAEQIYGKFLHHTLLQPENEEIIMESAVLSLKRFALKHYAKNPAITKWVKQSKAAKFSDKANIGAIVVNCNPFTKGHLYLIEKAISEVDGLYLFVVEENRSVFSFEDRLQMVYAGTEHLLDKVQVVPSGKFIISSLSFPKYFDKENAQTSVDTSNDVILFGSMIAPGLKIGKRFVGEEPSCVITAGYNETMKRLLPAMGIAVSVIPRILHDGSPISASRVRLLMQAGDLEGIQAIVPPSTYDHLLKVGFLRSAPESGSV